MTHRVYNWVMAATLICVASMFIACTSAIADNPAANDDGLAQKALRPKRHSWSFSTDGASAIRARVTLFITPPRHTSTI